MSASELEQLRLHLEQVRLEFERYFSGLEKRLPARSRAEITRAVRRFQPGNDAVIRFKHRNLQQRLLLLEQYWERMQRAIEAGTLKREIARADYRQRHRQAAKPTQAARSSGPPTPTEAAREAEAFMEQLGRSAPAVQMRGTRSRGNSRRGGHDAGDA